MTPRIRAMVASGDLVELAPVQAAYHDLAADGRVTVTSIAKALGWSYDRGHKRTPDTTRVQRALGLRGEYARKQRERLVNREYTTYDRAVALCRAMGVDPVDVGL